MANLALFDVCHLTASVSVIFFGLLLSFAYQQSIKKSDTHQWIRKDGDIMLKGLFPITSQDGGKCERLDTTGVTWMMAMIYAVDKINNDSSILHGKTIGYEIENTCQSIPTSMRFAIQIVSKYRPNSVCRSQEDCCSKGSDNQREDKRISAVVGPAASWISIPVARLLGLYGIPQISYASTSRILGDKTRYSSFLRTVPSDEFQAQAMAEFVRHFHWNYVFLIASDDDYGKMGAAAFKVATKNLSVCIANDVFIAFGSPNSDRQIDDTMSKLQATERAKVVIVFSYLEEGERLLKRAEQFKITDRTWVTSDGWNSINSELSNLNVSRTLLRGLFSFSIRSKQVKEFEKFMRGLSIQNAQNNSWFKRFLEESLQCSASQNPQNPQNPLQSMKTCNPDAKLPKGHEIATDFVANVIDAVYVIAYAVHNILTCKTPKCIPNTSLPITPEALFEYASDVNFQGVDYNRVNFDKDGERIASDYVIRNLQLSNEKHLRYIDVGHWNKNGTKTSFSVNQSLIQWNSGQRPVSTCFRKCQAGERVVGQSECCWNCQKCDKGKVSFSSGSATCTACNETHYANAERTQCILRKVVYLKYSDPAGIAILTISCLDMVLLTLVAAVFIQQRNTPVVSDSGPCMLILFFITLYLSFIVTIIQVTKKPTDASCMTVSVVLLLIFFFYAAFFLAKTKSVTRLLKIALSRFSETHMTRLQLLEVGVLLLPQIIFIIVWQATSLSVARFQNQEDSTRLLECYESFPASHIIAAFYPIAILVLATFLAFRERHIPDNFNEAKSISFSTLALCILLVAFIPTYRYVVGSNRILVIAFTLFVAAFACMGCLFIPKLYIIFLRSERNSRATNHETNGNSVTHPDPSFDQTTASGNCVYVKRGIGHVNFGASNGNLATGAELKENEPAGSKADSKQTERKETNKSDEVEISSISEVLAYTVN